MAFNKEVSFKSIFGPLFSNQVMRYFFNLQGVFFHDIIHLLDHLYLDMDMLVDIFINNKKNSNVHRELISNLQKNMSFLRSNIRLLYYLPSRFQNLIVQSHNVNDLICQCIEDVKLFGLQEVGSINIHFIEPKNVYYVLFDEIVFRLHFHNLLSNSINVYRNIIRSINIYITIGKIDDRHIVINYLDDGVGATPDDLANVFRPGFSRWGGSGMGLTISKILVDRAGGEIRVTSKPGHFFKIATYLPIAA